MPARADGSALRADALLIDLVQESHVAVVVLLQALAQGEAGLGAEVVEAALIATPCQLAAAIRHQLRD